MPKVKTPKNLVVDGTAKLAAKSKPSDKHEALDLNIEEATIASPRPSRKRAGDFFDFGDGTDAEPLSNPTELKSAKPRKGTKKASASRGENLHQAGAKSAAAARKGKKGQKANTKAAEPVERENRSRTHKTTKDDLAGEKPESFKKPKKVTNESAGDRKPKTDAIPTTAKAEKKTKIEKSKVENDAAAQESSAIASNVAINEGLSEQMLKPEKEHVTESAEKQNATASEATKGAKTAKKSAKESKASKVGSAEASAVDTAVANLTRKRAKPNTENAKQAANTKAAATETAAEVAEVIKKGAKVGIDKTKQVAKPLATAEEAPAATADIRVQNVAKAGAEETKQGVQPKYSKTVGNDESVNITESTEETKSEASKSRKRKASASADAEGLKANILDPLVKHASAKKKQKKESTTSKPIGDTVEELLATAAEGANAARASLGGIATSIIAGASEAIEGATGAKQTAKASAKKAKGKGRAIADNVAESSGMLAAFEGPGQADSEDDSVDGPDDHVIALLAGFEGDSDQESIVGSGFQPGQKIPPLPQEEITMKKLADVKSGAKEGTGVVYIGRIPHGFYEHEMREYFSQFGDINRLRLSRNRKSGASKHYAFVEFKSAAVAQIVADTMDNYLMFGHILKCKTVSQEQVHENIWKGANKRFKAVPWNKIEGRKLEMGLGREQWAARIEGEKKRRASKNQKTKEIGYEFNPGELKGIDQVPFQNAAKKIENRENVEEEKSLVTTGGEDGNDTVVVVSEEVKTKKVKGKSKGTATAGNENTKRALDVGEEAVGLSSKKIKMGESAAV